MDEGLAVRHEDVLEVGDLFEQSAIASDLVHQRLDARVVPIVLVLDERLGQNQVLGRSCIGRRSRTLHGARDMRKDTIPSSDVRNAMRAMNRPMDRAAHPNAWPSFSASRHTRRIPEVFHRQRIALTVECVELRGGVSIEALAIQAQAAFF